MPFNGAGTFTRLYSWAADKIANIKILATRMDDEMNGFATGLSNTITRDGQSTVIASIPWNGQRLTFLGDATADGDALNRRSGDARYGRLGADNTFTGAQTFSGPAAFAASATFAIRPTFNGKTPYDTGNLDPSTFPVLAGPNTFTGANTFQGSFTSRGSASFTSTTATSFAVRPTFNGATPWDSGNLNPSNYVANNNGGRQDLAGTIAVVNYFDIVRGGVLRARWIVDGSGNIILQNGDNGDNFFYVTTGGGVWTKQIGDLNARIENRAAAFADDRKNSSVTGMRWVFAGELTNDWNYNNGFQSPYGGYAAIVDRGTFDFLDYAGARRYYAGQYRWRYLQYYMASTGWVTVGAAS